MTKCKQPFKKSSTELSTKPLFFRSKMKTTLHLSGGKSHRSILTKGVSTRQISLYNFRTLAIMKRKV